MDEVLDYCKYFLNKYFIQLNLHLEYCEAITNFNLIGGIVMCLWRRLHICVILLNSYRLEIIYAIQYAWQTSNWSFHINSEYNI